MSEVGEWLRVLGRHLIEQEERTNEAMVERVAQVLDDGMPQMAMGNARGVARAAIAAAFKWQPIETAPKDGRTMLLWCGTVERLGGWVLYNEQGTWAFDGGHEGQPTHWMPLPERPGQNEEKRG